MSLREKLTKPLAIEPIALHTHTVIFLHRFPTEITDVDLRTKVISEKMTRNHKKLSEQFPAVRWVFPYAKTHARHWSNLSTEDKAELGLTMRLPYITQIILQEAEGAGGINKIILGGQGEAAEAAHDAMSSFPEMPLAMLDQPDKLSAFIQENFHPEWTELCQLQLAGFVGMHAQDGSITRDVQAFSVMSKSGNTNKVNNTIVINTPHRFINGGYKLQTTTWDGRRIDDFADFLASVGVGRINFQDANIQGKELLNPKQRSSKKTTKTGELNELNEKQKHALQIIKQKAETQKQKEIILRRIEADKVERKIRQERERQARLCRAQAQDPGTAVLATRGPMPARRADFIGVDESEEGFWDEPIAQDDE